MMLCHYESNSANSQVECFSFQKSLPTNPDLGNFPMSFIRNRSTRKTLQKGNYSGIFREPIDLSTDFAWHRVRKGLYALESSKIY